MNLYLVKRTDECDYDEFDAFVVAATSAQEAEAMCNFHAAVRGPLSTTLLGIAAEGIAGEILGSFNAG